MSHDTPPTDDRRCTAGILFALPIEADAFERRVTDRRTWRSAGPAFQAGRLGNCSLAWCVTGIGGRAAERATRLLIAGHRPAVIISAGFAGGLDPGLPRGSVVRPTAVVTADPGSRLTLAGGDAAGLVLASVSDPVVTPDDKRRLAAATAAAVVDMETHAIATVAAAAGLPCRCVRVVSDDASQALPQEVAALARPQSAARRIGAVLGAFGRRPAVAADLWRLYEHAVVDGRTLAAALEGVVRDLAASPTASLPGAGPAGPAAGRGRAT